MARKEEIRKVFQNVSRKCYDSAQAHLTEQLPAIMDMARRYALAYQHGDFGNMTGNWLNSFGVVLYRDGRPVAVANMSAAEVDGPIRTTLIEGDWFKRGEHRYDDTYQRVTFEIDGEKYKGAAEQVFYDEEVLDFLGSTWSKQKSGFSFRVVSIAEYHRDAASMVLLQVGDEMEARGGNIWQFNLE